MRSNLFAPENQEKESAQPGLRLQNSKMLKIELDGEALARQGSMVAYQGEVAFEAEGPVPWPVPGSSALFPAWQWPETAKRKCC